MAAMRQTYARLLAKFGNAIARTFDSYHPERHYMRGPGPRWRAKHQDLIQIRG